MLLLWGFVDCFLGIYGVLNFSAKVGNMLLKVFLMLYLILRLYNVVARVLLRSSQFFQTLLSSCCHGIATVFWVLGHFYAVAKVLWVVATVLQKEFWENICSCINMQMYMMGTLLYTCYNVTRSSISGCLPPPKHWVTAVKQLPSIWTFQILFQKVIQII